MKMDIIKILQEIAQNEHENFKVFKERLTQYCIENEKAFIVLFRLLRNTEVELSDCLKGNIHVKVERRIIIKVLKTLRIEIEIIRFRMKHPGLFEDDPPKTYPPVGKWTSKDIDLIELMYAVKKSVNRGRVSMKALQECFEYIFQIELGNIDERIKEIKKRKGNKAQFLENLIINLNKVHDELTEHTVPDKLKWKGSIVDYVEFGYALHAVNFDKNEKGTLKKLFMEMGEIFDIEVKDFSRVFIDIKNRVKGDRTKFLDAMKRELIKRIEDAEGKMSGK